MRYHAVGRHNITTLPEWQRLDPEVRKAVEVVSHVLPFRANRYVMENLIDWSKVPNDPIFQLVFPHRDMLSIDQFRQVEKHLGLSDKNALNRVIHDIRLDLNPHPNGQLTHNVPVQEGRPLWGLQHKYRETVLFFPFQGQTCHAYCTYCFRWAQFVDMDGLKFSCKDSADLVAYLKDHREVTDVLITGGDPLVMRTSLLRKYIEPLLDPELKHIQNVRIGTKAVAYWPHRFVSDPDADDLLRLFEEIVFAGRQLAIMGHYSHAVELEPEIAREAIRRIRNTGAQIRMQAPLIKHVNDDAAVWSSMWRTGLGLGLIPYYMFIERDTGAKGYFEVPLVQAYEIYREAYSGVSGLARSVQGPSMSAFPGKVRVLGVVSLRSMLNGRSANRPGQSFGAPASDLDEKALVFDFIQARDPSLVRTLFFAKYDPAATWFDQLRPAFGIERFEFECAPHSENSVPARSLTECLLN